MKQTQFFVELKEEINSKDFGNLRLLYLPIIGSKAIMIFHLLFDYFNFNNYGNAFYSLSELLKMLGFSKLEFKKQHMKLEAVGLIRSFEKSDENSFIFRLNKPLSPQEFRKNKFLYKNAISKIGEIIFERIEFNQKVKIIEKDDYNEITTKYQDLFALDSKENINQNTLEIALPNFKSKENAICSLAFSQFVFYLTGNKISPSQMHNLQDLFNQGFSNKALNLMIDYSFIVNNKIIINHIKKIASDFQSKEIKDAYTIKLELEKAFISHSNKIKETPIFENENDSDQDWNDIFESLGSL